MGSIREQLKYAPLVIGFIAVGIGFNFAPSATMGVIAGVFFVLAFLCMIEDRLLERSGRRAQGTVVDHRVEEDCFFPVIEFHDSGGATRREATRMGRGVKKPPVGSRVVVVYDPTGKVGCEIDRFWRRRGFAVALSLFGVVFTVGAMLRR
jgi:hypothetical protein